jgi:putative two-component system response regulator
VILSFHRQRNGVTPGVYPDINPSAQTINTKTDGDETLENIPNANGERDAMELPSLILIVENNPGQAHQLRTLLQDHGHRVALAADGKQGLAKARELRPDLVISELVLPGMDGYTMCQALKQDEELKEIPLLLLTGSTEPLDLVRALQAGANYCITEPYDPDLLLARVEVALQDSAQPTNGDGVDGFTSVIGEEQQIITSGPLQIMRFLFSTCENTLAQNWQLTREQRRLRELAQDLEEKVQESKQRLRTCFVGIAETLSSLVEVRDPYTAGHSKNVAALSGAIAGEMGVDEDNREGLWISAMLHDIGKVSISEGILSKAGELTKHEWGLIREHPTTAYHILRHVPFPWPIAEVIHQHHERLDGSGYPLGIKRHLIHLWARILAVADVVDAMMSHRPYRPRLSVHDTINELLQGRSTVYDGAIVDICIRLLRRQTSRILILDDDADLVDVLAGALRFKGFDVSGFHSPKQALEAFEKDPFPFVVTDLWMPEMNGLELMRRINRIDPTTKVILISGAGEKEHVLEAMRLGAADFLEKPFDMDHFGSVVSNVIKLAALR